MGRTRDSVAVGVLMLAVLVGGCGDGRVPDAAVSDTGGPAPSHPSDPPDPVDLVGLWEVLDAGDKPGAILRLGVRDLRLFRECGVIDGDWNTDGAGAFLAGRGGWSSACGDDPWPVWLASAAAHRPDGPGHVLLDQAGAVLARLVPGQEPTLPPTVAQSLAEPPAVTGDTHRELAPAAPLPDGVAAADGSMLLGRWIPNDAPPASRAQVEVLADGTWRGSDGCNGVGGRWRPGPGGAFLPASSGETTAIGCENIPVGSRLRASARAGFDGDALVLFGRQGSPLGRFDRSDCDPTGAPSTGAAPGKFATAVEAARSVPGLPPGGRLVERAAGEYQVEFGRLTGPVLTHRLFAEGTDAHGWSVAAVEECA